MQIFRWRLFFFIFLLNACAAQKKITGKENGLRNIIDQNFKEASAPYKLMMKKLPPDKFPKTFYAADNKFQTTNALSPQKYKAAVGDNGNFILKHSTGSAPGYAEIDVPLTYADYYFVEAMKRYKDLQQ